MPMVGGASKPNPEEQPQKKSRLIRVGRVLAILVVLTTVELNVSLWKDSDGLDTDEHFILPSRHNSALKPESPRQHSPALKPKPLRPQSVLSHNLEENPLLKILKQTNLTITPEEEANLPEWSEVTSRFGDKPVIIGLDACQRFRREIQRRNRIVAPAGTFNTGTNFLFSLMNKNCMVHRKVKNPPRTGVDWQVNWGKHEPIKFRLDKSVHDDRNNSNVLPVVVIRDPWSWLQSMCRNSYQAHWYHIEGPEGHCPNFVPNEVERKWFGKSKRFLARYFDKDPMAVHNAAAKSGFELGMDVIPLSVKYKLEKIPYESLIHLWKDWYQEYFDAQFPRLMIRLEDLVFHPYEVLKSVCDCAGGSFNEANFTLKGESTKGNSTSEVHRRTRQTNLLSAFFLHTRSNRTAGMTVEDIAYVKRVLRESVAATFGYNVDVDGV